MNEELFIGLDQVQVVIFGRVGANLNISPKTQKGKK